MQYLTDITGGYSAESRSILRILQRVIFKDFDNPKQISCDVLNSLIHSEKHHGIKFVVDGMKNLKSRIIAGLALPKNRKSKMLNALKKLGRTNQLRFLSLCYRWKAKKPTKSTYLKFCRSINQGRKFTNRAALPDKYYFTKSDMKVIDTFASDARVKFSPLQAEGAHVLEGNVVEHGPQHIADELFAMTDAGSIFLDHIEYLEQIFDLDQQGSSELQAAALNKVDLRVIGQIVALDKDGALKLRHVANLAKGWQVAISPLVDFYKRIEEYFCPQSANWNQLEGAIKAAEATKDGFDLSSFDVVSSTDNIPRDLFFELMDPVIEHLPKGRGSEIIRRAYALDKALCEQGVYLTPFNQRAWYDIGQAMGRWTSKPQLNLTELRLNHCAGGNQYNSAINGDDVIVWDDDVSVKMENLYDDLGIPLNIIKSFIRLPSGEFSGRIVTREEGILPVYRGKPIKPKSDPTGPIRQYGLAGLKLLPQKSSLPKKIKRIAKYLVGRDCGADEFVAEAAIEPESAVVTDFLLTKKPDLEKTRTPQGLVDQVFVAEDPEGFKASEDYLHHFLWLGTRSSSYKQKLDKCRYYTEKSRRRKLFRRAAVRRFPIPSRNQMGIDLIVDNLNAQYVSTSDGATISNYGKGVTGAIYKRLVKEVSLPFTSHKPYDEVTPEQTISKKQYFNRFYRKVRRWEQEIRRFEDVTKPSHPERGIFGKFIDWFFG